MSADTDTRPPPRSERAAPLPKARSPVRDRVVLLLVVSTLSAPSFGGAPGSALYAQEMAVDRILARAMEAIGGTAKWDEVSSLVVRGRVELLGGFLGRYESRAVAPDRRWTRWELDFYSHERGFDGEAGWERIASVRELRGDALRRLERASLFHSLHSYMSRSVPVSLAGTERVAGATAYVVEFRPPGAEPERFFVDTETFLVLREESPAPYEEGLRDVVLSYGDYRQVDGVVVPFRLEVDAPDLYYSVDVEEYDLDARVEPDLFQNPHASRFHEPLEVTLSTIPRRVFKEFDGHGGEKGEWKRYWGIPFTPTESWVVNVLVEERYGRWLEPRSATVDLYAGEQRVKRVEFGASELETRRKFPATRFGNVRETFHFHHYFSEPASLGIDRMVYTAELATEEGEVVRGTVEIPLSRYDQKSRLVFPIRGPFIVTNGHEFYELGHKYEWSQQYAYDIVGLGPDLALAADGAEETSDYYTYGIDVVAPAAGTVVYARNDVPDDATRAQFQKLPDPMWSFAGNSVLIDHANGEYSLMVHLQHGSVRVEEGDRVEQGEVVARLGSSASPGFPHLHYQLQAGPVILRHDGLPSRFENVETLRGGQKVATPKRGVYLIAK